MTDNPTPSPARPQGAPTGPDGSISVDVQVVMDAYAAELATLSQRAIMAEATVRALQNALSEARQTIHALSPGAPTTPEG